MLSTSAARSAEVYEWSRGVRAGDPSWQGPAVVA
jgi:hypothetical protein